MLRGLASRCLEPVNSTRRSSHRRAKLLANSVSYRYMRYRRSGDGRKRDAFEERSAASQEEYFRRETARQLAELREQLKKRKTDEEGEPEQQPKRRRRGRKIVGSDATSNPTDSSTSN